MFAIFVTLMGIDVVKKVARAMIKTQWNLNITDTFKTTLLSVVERCLLHGVLSFVTLYFATK